MGDTREALIFEQPASSAGPLLIVPSKRMDGTREERQILEQMKQALAFWARLILAEPGGTRVARVSFAADSQVDMPVAEPANGDASPASPAPVIGGLEAARSAVELRLVLEPEVSVRRREPCEAQCDPAPK